MSESVAGGAGAGGKDNDAGDLGIRAVRVDVIRSEQVDDAVRLWADAGLTRPWNDARADLRRALEGETSTVLAATQDSSTGSALVGTVMVGHDGHRGWMYYLAVDDRWRGRGIGRMLVREAEDWLRLRDVPKAQLMVRGSNSAAVGFYEALGYSDQSVTVLGRFFDPELEARRLG